MKILNFPNYSIKYEKGRLQFSSCESLVGKRELTIKIEEIYQKFEKILILEIFLTGLKDWRLARKHVSNAVNVKKYANQSILKQYIRMKKGMQLM